MEKFISEAIVVPKGLKYLATGAAFVASEKLLDIPEYAAIYAAFKIHKHMMIKSGVISAQALEKFNAAMQEYRIQNKFCKSVRGQAKKSDRFKCQYQAAKKAKSKISTLKSSCSTSKFPEKCHLMMNELERDIDKILVSALGKFRKLSAEGK